MLPVPAGLPLSVVSTPPTTEMLALVVVATLV
jgi:hypothetical protein